MYNIDPRLLRFLYIYSITFLYSYIYIVFLGLICCLPPIKILPEAFDFFPQRMNEFVSGRSSVDSRLAGFNRVPLAQHSSSVDAG